LRERGRNLQCKSHNVFLLHLKYVAALPREIADTFKHDANLEENENNALILHVQNTNYLA